MKASRARLAAFIFAALTVGAAGLFTAVADDDDDDDHERAKRLQQSGEILSLEKIVERARVLYPKGKILEIEFKDKSGRLMYEIEILDKRGVVNELMFDARTGEHLETKLED